VMSKAWAWAAQAALCYMLLLRFDAAVSRLAYCKVRDREPSDSRRRPSRGARPGSAVRALLW
jgi:hypothetical protein